MTGLSKVFDAAVPPSHIPPGCTGALGYIGRAGLAARVWTSSDWAMTAHLTRFFCWVPDLANHAGTEAAAIIRALGAGPAGACSVVVIDYETAGGAAAAWHSHLAQALGAAGFDAVAYGSLSTVMGIGAAHVWAADWDWDAVLDPAAQTVHAHQYAAGVPAGNGYKVDLSVADDWLMTRGLRP